MSVVFVTVAMQPSAVEAAPMRWGMNPGAEVQDLRLTTTDDAGLASMADVGTTEIRFAAAWRLADPTGRAAAGGAPWDWSWFDDDVASAARHGMRWAPFLCWPPDTDTRAPGAPSCGGPPTDPGRWSAFVTAFVERYGTGGDFWAAHSELPDLPIQTIEIYNEPNLGEVWPAVAGTAPAVEYARLYFVSRKAVRSVPQGEGIDVMFASLAPITSGKERDGEIPWETFLSTGLASTGEQPVDSFGFHPYMTGVDSTDPVKHVLDHLREFRSALTAGGRSGVPIDVTELGIATRYDFLWGPAYLTESITRFTEDERAAFYRRVIPAVANAGLGVASISPLFFSADRDVWSPPTDFDALELNRWIMTIFSIAEPDGTLRASGRSYRAAVSEVVGRAAETQVPAPISPSPQPVVPSHGPTPTAVVPSPSLATSTPTGVAPGITPVSPPARGPSSSPPVRPAGAPATTAGANRSAATKRRAAAKRRAAVRRRAAARRRARARARAVARRESESRRPTTTRRAARGEARSA